MYAMNQLEQDIYNATMYKLACCGNGMNKEAVSKMKHIGAKINRWINEGKFLEQIGNLEKSVGGDMSKFRENLNLDQMANPGAKVKNWWKQFKNTGKFVVPKNKVDSMYATKGLDKFINSDPRAKELVNSLISTNSFDPATVFGNNTLSQSNGLVGLL